jgi:hypothetical protein
MKDLLDIEQSSLVSDTNTIVMTKKVILLPMKIFILTITNTQPKQMLEHFEKGQSQLIVSNNDDQDETKHKNKEKSSSSQKRSKRDLAINTNHNHNSENTNSNTKSPKGFETKSPKSPHPLFGQGNTNPLNYR